MLKVSCQLLRRLQRKTNLQANKGENVWVEGKKKKKEVRVSADVPTHGQGWCGLVLTEA